jgi:hypothetical protein
MSLRKFLSYLYWPFLLGSAFLTLLTFASYFGKFPMDTKLGWLLNSFDLRNEANVATWFEGLLFVYCGITFACLGCGGNKLVPSIEFKFPRPLSFFFKQEFLKRIFFQVSFFVLGLAGVFGSLDEMVSIHEGIGHRVEKNLQLYQNTALQDGGYTWVFLYLPVVIFFLAILLFIYIVVIRNRPDREKSCKWVWTLICVLPIFLCGILMGEIFEMMLKNQGIQPKEVILPCFEEMFELVSLLILSLINLFIADSYKV